MAEIISNQFNCTINRTLIAETSNNTQIIISKGNTQLTAVNTVPTIGQYRVTIENTVNCTAKIEDDYKTIALLNTTGNSGEIRISINIENKKTVNKTIPVASITSSNIISSHYTEHQQLADKFTWLVKSGTSSSNMELTDELFNLVSKNITLTADRINLNGYVSNEDESWSITNDGLFNTKDMNVDGDISCDSLNATYINSPKYPATLDGTIDVYVNSSTGNDDNVIGDEVVFATLQGAIDAIPKFMNGKTVRITLQTNCTENIKIDYFTAGAIRIFFDGKTLYGNVKSYACYATVNIYGGTSSDTTASTGVIHPSAALSFGGRSVSVGFEACGYSSLNNMKIYAPDNLATTNTEKVAVGAQSGNGTVYISTVQIVNAVIGFRANNMGRMQIASSSGIASKYAFQSHTGGQIGLHNASQAGGSTANTNKDSGGFVWYDSAKFASGSATTDSGTASTPTTTKTMTIKSSYGDTYRSTVYNNWKKDNTCRQGDYGYGDCTGVWFFGTAFADVKGKTITKVQITIKRQTGGTSASVEHKLWMHRHTGRPSGAPSLTSGWSQTFNLATGDSKPITITNSTVLNAISDGTCKGFALRHTYDSSHYSVCSGSCTVKITYQE